MTDKRKVRFLVGLTVVVIVTLIGSLLFVVSRIKQTDKERVSQSTVQTHSTQEKRRSDLNANISHSSNEDLQKLIVGDDELNEFLSLYFNWDLTEKSVTERATLLEPKMSADCYQRLGIESERDAMVQMIRKYEEDKEINTSNSTQLITSRLISSRVYQNTTDTSNYLVQVKLEQTPPYQETTKPIDKSYRLVLVDGKVTYLQETNTN